MYSYFRIVIHLSLLCRQIFYICIPYNFFLSVERIEKQRLKAESSQVIENDNRIIPPELNSGSDNPPSIPTDQPPQPGGMMMSGPPPGMNMYGPPIQGGGPMHPGMQGMNSHGPPPPMGPGMMPPHMMQPHPGDISILLLYYINK